jgi:pimeloyl-ACP methyl ester carboxylesterase
MIHPIVIESAGGEYMDTVVVLEWHSKVGDAVKAGDLVVTVETAKAATEIEASKDGFLAQIFFEVGQEAPIGSVLGNIKETADEEAVSFPAGSAGKDKATALATTSVAENVGEHKADRVFATPLARRIAGQRGIDLAKVTGTGPRGRIKLRDVEAASPPLSAVDRPTALPDRAALLGSSQPQVRALAPIVLLHGFGADRSAWRLVGPLLKSSHTLILPELPGHGNAPEMSVSGIDDIAFAISDTLQSLGIDEAHLVGHSLGGAAALALTRIGRLRVRSLCLIAPGGLGPEIDFAFLKGFVAAAQPESLQPWLERMVANPAVLPEGYARAVLRQRERTNVQAPQQRLLDILFPDGVQSIRLRSAFEAVRVPAKVVWGLKDAIIPPSHAFTAPGNVGIHLLRDIGHVPQLECPALVAQLIDELVTSQS